MTDPPVRADALSRTLVRQRPELAGHVHYVNGRPWCDGVNHTTMCDPAFTAPPGEAITAEPSYQVTVLPTAAVEAAHTTAFEHLDDLKRDIEREYREQGCVTSKLLRLALQLLADDVIEAAAPHITTAERARCAQLADTQAEQLKPTSRVAWDTLRRFAAHLREDQP